MSTKLRVLILEDRPADAELMLRELQRAGYTPEWKRVETEPDYLAQLDQGWDVILADYTLPAFDGLRALALLKERGLDIPFVIVSGSIGEEVAVEAVKNGAGDYVSKGNLRRLGAAVERELRDAKDRYERRKAETTLRMRERDLSDAQHVAHLGSWSVDAAGSLTWSDELYRIYGLAPETFSPDVEAFVNLVHPEDQSAMTAWIAAYTAGRKPGELEFRVVWPDGTVRHISGRGELTCDAAGTPLLMTGTAQDVTARKQAEAALRLQKAALDAAANAVVIFDSGGRITYVNAAFSAWTGYDTDHAMGRTTRELTRPIQHDEAFYGGVWATLLAGDVWRGEIPMRRSDGTHIPAEVTGTPLRGPDGEVTHVIAIYQDITERKESEIALREAQTRLSVAAQAGNVGLWDWDLRTNAVYYSPEWKRQVGYADEELLNDSNAWESRVHPDDLARVREIENAAIAGTTSSYETSYRFRHRDGSYRHILARGTVARDDAGAAVRMSGAHVDITELTQLQAQLLQAQKMESVGRLTGGVAHDFNNLLSVIMCWTEIAMAELPVGHPTRPPLEDVLSAARGAARLTKQLLSFSRQQLVEPTVFDVNDLIVEIDTMLRTLVGEDIEYVTKTEPELDTVKMDRSQLEQVLLNLVVNARDAMPEGGRLSIETAHVNLDAAYPRKDAEVTPGEYVMIAVSDSGTGMTNEVKQRIFEPFFTTKEVGKGTGLGLATSYGIVKQAGGHFVVYSEEGVGTTMKVYLPRVRDAAQRAMRHRPTTPLRGTEAILVVEDEPAVRRAMAHILEAQGYHVRSVGDGKEALRVIAAERERLHLLLTDVVLAGGMSGPVLAEQARILNPDLEVLFVSGYTSEAAFLQGMLEQRITLVQKPFTAESLGGKVREVLDAR